MADEQYINPNSPVYISFTGKDEAVADTLCGLLRQRCIGYRIYTEEDIDKISEFEKEIGNSKIVIILYSPAYFQSYHCMNEYALIRKKEEGKKIYTLKCERFNFKDIQYDLLRHWGGEKAVHQTKVYSTFTPVVRMAFDNAFYIDEETKYSVQMLEQFFRDVPYYAEDLTLLSKNIEDYILSNEQHEKQEDRLPNLYFTTRTKIVARDKETDEIYSLFNETQFVNMTGMGGCGKTTITELFVNKYREKYNKITGIFINGDFYQDMINKFTGIFNFKSYEDIIASLEKYPKTNNKFNLFIIDINETADYKQIEKALDDLRKSQKLVNWKILIVSRIKIHSQIVEFEPLNVMNINNTILKHIFFHYLTDNKRTLYSTFTDIEFDKLFCVLYHLPLLLEQLAYFLNKVDKYSLREIFDYLGVKITEGELAEETLISNSLVGRKEVYERVGDYLSKLLIFSKLDEAQQSGTLQRDIVRHLMMWPIDYYRIKTIMLLIVDENNISKKKEREIQKGLTALVDKCIIDTKDENGLKSYKIHGLIAETFRKQCFEEDVNVLFRNYDIFLENIKKCIKDKKNIYDSWLNNNPEYTNDLNNYKYGTNNPIIDDYIKNKMIFVKGIGQLNDFYIGETQVTQGIWMSVMGQNNNPSFCKNGNEYPVENLSWYDCLVFFIELNKKTKLKFRLPNGIEWAYAAHAGIKNEPYLYSGSDDIDEIACYSSNSSYPVGQLKPNGLGIYDMSGNVWEWCEFTSKIRTHGFATSAYATLSFSSEKEKNDSQYCIFGGSYLSDASSCQISRSLNATQIDDYDDCGFRITLSAT